MEEADGVPAVRDAAGLSSQAPSPPVQVGYSLLLMTFSAPSKAPPPALPCPEPHAPFSTLTPLLPQKPPLLVICLEKLY